MASALVCLLREKRGVFVSSAGRPQSGRVPLNPFCGDMQARPSQLLARNPSGGVLELFRGRRVGFSFLTRVAIRKACDLLGLQPGDEVLAPAYNCGSELDPLRHAGLTVTLFPVDRRTRIDPDAVQRRITAKTRAIYLTHYFGVLHPETRALRALCDQHGLALIEDCALSLLSGTAPVEGVTGDVAVFCFYKFFPTLGGGALVLNADRIPGSPTFALAPPQAAARRHLLRMGMQALPGLGQLVQARRRTRGHRPDAAGTTGAGLADMPASYYFDPALTDARISALAMRPLASFDVGAIIAARRANYTAYLDVLASMPSVRPLFPELAPETCPLCMPVLVEDRDALAAALQARGMAATPWWAGYNRHLDFTGQTEACFLKDHVLSLPVHQDLGQGAPAHVLGELRRLVSPGSSARKAGPGRPRPETAA
jgi:dTDP-4-amino-4,6-dideoxygalactose transaminase